MSDIHFDTRSSEWVGDMTVWLRENSEDNALQLERMHRNLRKARQRELTPRQQEFLLLYYEKGYSMPQIAEMYGINRSTVCRTLQRAKQRLHRVLQYSV